MKLFTPPYPLIIALINLVFSVVAASPISDYHEQLLLKPLPHNSLLASFNFRSNTDLAEFEAHNFRLFPRSLGRILQHAGTRELHLRFSMGHWDAETWGSRPWNGTKEGVTGVELWAWLEADTRTQANHKWLTLTNALSGLFCASLNFIDSTRTTQPGMSFHPEGDHPNIAVANMHLLHGVLPREVVCTENLTPYLKLLPCKGKAGISSLLDGRKLFDASWQSMAIDVRPVCTPSRKCVLEIEQTIDMVLDIDRSKRPRDNPIPRPPPGQELKCDKTRPYHSDDTCYPTELLSSQDWTMSQVFGKSMKGTCPLADPVIPPVCVQVPYVRDIFTSLGTTEKKTREDERCYLMPSVGDFELILPHIPNNGDNEKTDADELVKPETPLLYAERSFTGHGQQRGGVQTILTNPSLDTEVEFVYMESLPWFMRVYMHTMQTHISVKTDSDKGGTLREGDQVIQETIYRPFQDRERGTQLELRMRIPPASTVFLTYDFEKTILRYTEYPPDANRGFDVAGAVITIKHPSGKISNIRTTGLLLNLPTPDFSMPYNVIVFTSNAVAFSLGGLFSILVRRFVGRDEGPEGSLSRLRKKIFHRIRKVKNKINDGKLGDTAKNDSTIMVRKEDGKSL